MNAEGAKVLRLQGSGDATWDKSASTWLDASGTLTAFSDGDSAVIASDYTGAKVSLAAEVNPSTLVITNAQEVDLVSSDNGKLGSGVTSIAKYGSGKLRVQGNNDSVCDWHIHGGELTVVDAWSSWSGHTFGNYDGHDVTVHLYNGAKMTFPSCGGFGNNAIGDEDKCGNLTVHEGATFTPGVTGTYVYPFISIKDLTLDGGSIDLSQKGYWELGTLKITRTWAFSGSTPYTINRPNSNAGSINLATGRQTEFRVADITGDDAVDVTIATEWIGRLVETNSAGIRKTGPGKLLWSGKIYESEAKGYWAGYRGLNGGKITVEAGELVLDNVGNLNAGDIEVTGGVLRLGSGQSAYTVPSDLGQTYVGSLLKKGRTITASGTGSIHFAQRYMFYAPGSTGVTNVAPTTFVAKDGGQLVVGATNWSGTVHATVFFPNLRLENGGKVTLRDESGDWPNGAYGVMGKFSFGGSTPITVPAGTKQNHAFLLNCGDATVFEVEDITGNGEVDATFSLQMGRYVYGVSAEDQKSVGFRKTGEGTLLMDFTVGGLGAAGMSAPNGTVSVEEGTLILASSLTDVTLSVAAGAFLQPRDGKGNPAFKALTMAENGGFRVKANSLLSSVRVTNALTLPKVGVVDVLAADDVDVSRTKALFLTLPDNSTVSDADFASWQVTVNGQPSDREFRIFRNGNGVYVKCRHGSCLILR